MGNLLGIRKFSYGDCYNDSKVKPNVLKSEINPPQFSWIFHNHDGQNGSACSLESCCIKDNRDQGKD
jgi:hypothetical protein